MKKPNRKNSSNNDDDNNETTTVMIHLLHEPVGRHLKQPAQHTAALSKVPYSAV